MKHRYKLNICQKLFTVLTPYRTELLRGTTAPHLYRCPPKDEAQLETAEEIVIRGSCTRVIRGGGGGTLHCCLELGNTYISKSKWLPRRRAEQESVPSAWSVIIALELNKGDWTRNIAIQPYLSAKVSDHSYLVF